MQQKVERLQTMNSEKVRGRSRTLWSQALAVAGRNSPDEDIDAIRKVTVEDVNHVARKYLVNDTVVAAILESRSSGKAIPSESSMGKESFVKNR